MNKFLPNCCIFISCFLLFSGALSYPEQKITEGIYMCTKDIDKPGFLVSEKVINNYFSGDNFLPFEGIEESGEKHQFVRHCFMLRAKYEGTVIETDGSRKLNLIKLDSHAFGKEKGETVAYEEMLVDLPSNMAISCTVLIDENDLSEEEINKEMDIIRANVCDDENVCNDNAIEKKAAKGLIKKKWNKVVERIDIETLVNYNLGKHNCCSVAYKAAATIFDDDISKVMEKVDPTTFNVYGTGVVWSWRNDIIGSSWDLMELSYSSSSKVADISSNKEQGFDYDSSRNEQIEDREGKNKDEL